MVWEMARMVSWKLKSGHCSAELDQLCSIWIWNLRNLGIHQQMTAKKFSNLYCLTVKSMAFFIIIIVKLWLHAVYKHNLPSKEGSMFDGVDDLHVTLECDHSKVGSCYVRWGVCETVSDEQDADGQSPSLHCFAAHIQHQFQRVRNDENETRKQIHNNLEFDEKRCWLFS